jgi:hypothetical protein
MTQVARRSGFPGSLLNADDDGNSGAIRFSKTAWNAARPECGLFEQLTFLLMVAQGTVGDFLRTQEGR